MDSNKKKKQKKIIRCFHKQTKNAAIDEKKLYIYFYILKIERKLVK